MKLFKPIWVNHEDKPIFSIDIHPAGKRFATGGQGGDSGRVVVWNMSPVVYEHMETDPNVPKLLCQMDNHLACVNCVRWSNGGKYLASGGDDRLVMVWTLSGSSATPGSKHKTESWRCVSTLRGHAGDVLDLAWSPLDKWLASCSVDNSIIIWNGEKFPEMVCVLNGHTGLVKGVAWDPVGKYLASQSDDKSLRVWKTADWGQETVITDPFEDCGGTTHVLRLSWSPDGQYVVSAHAMNGGGPTAQVVERDGWRCDKDFVGHRKAVTCARFNNNILVKEGKKCCCAAVGSRDRALSIWLTSLKRPLVVVHDLFSDSVLDLCWSDDGLILLACSSDGSVACLQFTNQEIGTPLSLEEKNAFYEKTYGKCLANQSSGDLNTSNLLIECPEILLAREKQEANAKKEKESKEELTPKSEKSQNKLCSPSFVSSPGATPTRPVDRQIETRTSDGKRRITPVFIPLTTNPDGEPPGSSSENCFSTSSQSKSRIRVERRDDIIIHPNVSNHAPVRDKSPDAVPEPSLRKRAGAPLPGPRAPPAPAPARSPPPAHPAPRTDTPTCLPAAVLGAAGPVVRAAGPRRLQVVNNACSTPYGPLSKLQLLLNNSASSEPVWETYLGSPVNCVSCDARWIAAACESGVLHAWGVSPEGRVCRALPPVSLCGAAVRLALSAGVLVAVTVSARVCAWDLRRGSALLPAASIRPLLVPGVTLANCGLLDDGNVLLTMSNGNSYVYSKKLSSWVVWWSSLDPLWRCSGGSAWARPPTLGAKPQHAALARGEYASGAALSWLESRASAALQLRQAHEYKHWTLALVHHLATHGTENQLRNILDDMLGPSHCTSSPRTWETQILGIKKHDMLEEMLSILVSQLRWQRLYAEYSDQLRDLRHVPDTLITPQHPLDTPQHPPDIPQHPHNGHPDVEMAC